MTKSEKAYLGDGVYMDFDGYHIVLTTNNGREDTNTVYLEPEVLDNMLRMLKTMEQKWNKIDADSKRLGE